MTDKNEKMPLTIEEMENISGGRNDITELTSTCKGCMDITLWKKDPMGTWRCTVCNGTESIPYYELPQYKNK